MKRKELQVDKRCEEEPVRDSSARDIPDVVSPNSVDAAITTTHYPLIIGDYLDPAHHERITFGSFKPSPLLAYSGPLTGALPRTDFQFYPPSTSTRQPLHTGFGAAFHPPQSTTYNSFNAPLTNSAPFAVFADGSSSTPFSMFHQGDVPPPALNPPPDHTSLHQWTHHSAGQDPFWPIIGEPAPPQPTPTFIGGGGYFEPRFPQGSTNYSSQFPPLVNPPNASNPPPLIVSPNRIIQLVNIWKTSLLEDARGRKRNNVESYLNDFALNDTALNDTALNDTALNDTALNDTALNDTALNDTAVNGTAVNDSALDDLALNDFARPRSPSVRATPSIVSHPLASFVLPPASLRYVHPAISDACMYSLRVQSHDQLGTGQSPPDKSVKGPSNLFELACSTAFPGFENALRSDWLLALWAFLYYALPPLRLSLSQHQCNEAICWICELSFAFRNLDVSVSEGKGQPVQVRNLSEAILRAGPIASLALCTDSSFIDPRGRGSKEYHQTDSRSIPQAEMIGTLTKRIRRKYFPFTKSALLLAPTSSRENARRLGYGKRQGRGTRRILDDAESLLGRRQLSADSLMHKVQRRRERVSRGMIIREIETKRRVEQKEGRELLHFKCHQALNYVLHACTKFPRIDVKALGGESALDMSPGELFTIVTRTHVECFDKSGTSSDRTMSQNTSSRTEGYLLELDHSMWINKRKSDLQQQMQKRMLVTDYFSLPVSTTSSYVGTVSGPSSSSSLSSLSGFNSISHIHSISHSDTYNHHSDISDAILLKHSSSGAPITEESPSDKLLRNPHVSRSGGDHSPSQFVADSPSSGLDAPPPFSTQDGELTSSEFSDASQFTLDGQCTSEGWNDPPSFAELIQDSLWKSKLVSMTCSKCSRKNCSQHLVCSQIVSIPPILSLKIRLNAGNSSGIGGGSGGSSGGGSSDKTQPSVSVLDYWRTLRKPVVYQAEGMEAKRFVDPYVSDDSQSIIQENVSASLVQKWLRLRSKIVEGDASCKPQFDILTKLLRSTANGKNSPLPSALLIGKSGHNSVPDSKKIPTSSSPNPWIVTDSRNNLDEANICDCCDINCSSVHEYSLISVVCSTNYTWNRTLRKVLWEIWTSDLAPSLGLPPIEKQNSEKAVTRKRKDLVRNAFRRKAKTKSPKEEVQLLRRLEAEEACVAVPCSEDQVICYVKVPTTLQRSTVDDTKCHSKWLLINGPLTTFVEEAEVRRFSQPWKYPCAIFYARTRILWNSWFLSQLPPPPPPLPSLSDLLSVKSISQTPMAMRASPRFLSLTNQEQESIARKDFVVALDAEHVVVSTLCKQPFCIVGDHSLTALGRISVLRSSNNSTGPLPFLDHYLYFRDEPVDYRTEFSGLRPGDLDKKGSAHWLATQKQIYQIIRYLVENECRFIGHDLFNDFRVVGIVVPTRLIIDTVEIYRLAGSSRFLSLKFLCWNVLGLAIQKKDHDSIEDAHAALMLYRKYVDWLRTRSVKEWHAIELVRLYNQGYSTNFKVVGDGEHPATGHNPTAGGIIPW